MSPESRSPGALNPVGTLKYRKIYLRAGSKRGKAMPGISLFVRTEHFLANQKALKDVFLYLQLFQINVRYDVIFMNSFNFSMCQIPVK